MSATVLDVVAEVRDLLEPDPVPPATTTLTKDETAAEPFVWEPDTLYVYPVSSGETPIETGPTARQDFALLAVYVADSHEEPGMRRDPAVSSLLDTKRAQYIDAVRSNRVSPTWLHLRATERSSPPRTLQSRAVAIEIRGFRVIS